MGRDVGSDDINIYIYIYISIYIYIYIYISFFLGGGGEGGFKYIFVQYFILIFDQDKLF